MQKYINNIQNTSGIAVKNAAVYVYTQAGSIATIYSDNGITVRPNPIYTNDAGMFEFYAADGRYNLSINAIGQTLAINDILFEDLMDSSDAIFNDVQAESISIQGDDLSSQDGSNAIGFIQNEVGAVPRTLQGKCRDVVSVLDFSTPAIADDSTARTIYVQNSGANSTASSGAALNLNYYGAGQITTADGNKRGKWFSSIKVAPSSFGNHSGPDTAFNGDLSHSQFQIEHRITGTSTLGQPISGYRYTPEAYPEYMYLYNASGWNESTTTNDGRTAAVGNRIKISHVGQGDAVCFNGEVFVAGLRSGSTDWRANPAGVLFNGGMTAGSDGVGLTPHEFVLSDAGYDVAGIGLVMSCSRTNDTGAKGAFWSSFRSQSKGSKALDNAYYAGGPHVNGLDIAGADFTGAAIAMKANQKIALNGTASDYRYTNNIGGEWLQYSSANTETQFYGQSSVQFAVGRVASSVNYLSAGGAPTGAIPSLEVKGSDTNISASYSSKGSGQHFFYSDARGALQFSVGRTASAVNYFTARGGGTGVSAILEATGTDTNVGALYASKGSGTHIWRTGGPAGTTQMSLDSSGVLSVGTFTVNADAPVTGYITIKDVAGNVRKLAVIA